MRVPTALVSLLVLGVPAMGSAGAAEGPGPAARSEPRLVLVAAWKGPVGLVRSLAVHPTGRTVAAGSSDRALRFWDVATGKVAQSLTLPPGGG